VGDLHHYKTLKHAVFEIRHDMAIRLLVLEAIEVDAHCTGALDWLDNKILKRSIGRILNHGARGKWAFAVYQKQTGLSSCRSR
jgi:hypothetical protein